MCPLPGHEHGERIGELQHGGVVLVSAEQLGHFEAQ
jgi:hypothetical protein